MIRANEAFLTIASRVNDGKFQLTHSASPVEIRVFAALRFCDLIARKFAADGHADPTDQANQFVFDLVNARHAKSGFDTKPDPTDLMILETARVETFLMGAY